MSQKDRVFFSLKGLFGTQRNVGHFRYMISYRSSRPSMGYGLQLSVFSGSSVREMRLFGFLVAVPKSLVILTFPIVNEKI
jgi:hypothetical protein